MSRVNRTPTHHTYSWSTLRSPLDAIAWALLRAEVVLQGKPPRGGIAMDHRSAKEHGDREARERAAGTEKRGELGPEPQAVLVYFRPRLFLPRHLRSSPRSPSLLVALHRSRRVPASHAPATHPRRAGRGPSASAMPSTTSSRCVYSSPSCLLIPTLSPARAQAHEEETVKGCKRCVLVLFLTRLVACLFLLSSPVKHSRP